MRDTFLGKLLWERKLLGGILGTSVLSFVHFHKLGPSVGRVFPLENRSYYPNMVEEVILLFIFLK